MAGEILTGGVTQYVAQPYRTGVAVTPHDTTELTRTSRALYIGSIAGGATMTVLTADGDTLAFAGLVAGSVIPIAVRRVNSTATLASSIVALY